MASSQALVMAGFLRAPRRVLRVSFPSSVCAKGKGKKKKLKVTAGRYSRVEFVGAAGAQAFWWGSGVEEALCFPESERQRVPVSEI